MATTTYPVSLRGSRRVFTDLDKRIKDFTRAELVARQRAAQTAQAVSRAQSPSKRVVVGPRPGRPQTSRLRSNIDWAATSNSSLVQLDRAKLDRTNRYWIIQEIGTGQRATIKRAGVTNPAGRPAKGSAYVATVPAQAGRAIPGQFVWGGGGAYGTQNLFARGAVRGAPRPSATQRITKEIHGSHFIQAGAKAGFRQYRPSVLAAARQAFRK